MSSSKAVWLFFFFVKAASARLKRKYEKRGWSEAKIQRAIADATAVEKVRPTGLRADARDLIAWAADVGGTAHVLVHMYSGSPDTEKLAPEGGLTAQADELRSGACALEPDRLVTVVGQRGRTSAG